MKVTLFVALLIFSMSKIALADVMLYLGGSAAWGVLNTNFFYNYKIQVQDLEDGDVNSMLSQLKLKSCKTPLIRKYGRGFATEVCKVAPVSNCTGVLLDSVSLRENGNLIYTGKRSGASCFISDN